MRCRSFSHRLRNRWQALSSLLRGPSAAAGIVTAGIAAALLLMPAETACPDLNLANAVASLTVLDWVERSLDLILMLLRRLGVMEGG